MEDRGQFTFYRSYYEALRGLPKKEREPVLMAICAYALDGEIIPLSGMPAVVFSLVKPTLDTGRKKAANGKQGGSKTKANARQTESEKEKEGEMEIEKEKEKEKEIENECYISPPTPPRGTEYTQSFESFWSAYPKKTGKGAAFKSFQNAMRLTDLETILASLERHKRSQQWTRDNGQYIPMPATWLNQRRWEDEVEAPPERMKLAQGSSRSTEWRGDDGDLLEAMLG